MRFKLVCFFALVVIVAGCQNRESKAPSEAEIARAQDRELLAQGTLTSVSGRTLRVNIDSNRHYAVVSPEPVSQVANAAVIELAAAQVSGCDAVYVAPRDVRYLIRAHNLTVLDVFDRGPLRVRLYCDGRDPETDLGLRNVLPGNDASGERYQGHPKAKNTYLYFDHSHGYQVVYFDNDGRSWLWYPGNTKALAVDWKIDGATICFLHPEDSFNPVTKRQGGEPECSLLRNNVRMIVSDLSGDPFRLAGGQVPARDKCSAPDEFSFDRTLYGCDTSPPRVTRAQIRF